MTVSEVSNDRVNAVANALLGTAGSLEDHATEEEQNDTAFLSALDQLVILCETCGWWVEADLINDNGDCNECEVDA